jgi:hypothetical protein
LADVKHFCKYIFSVVFTHLARFLLAQGQMRMILVYTKSYPQVIHRSKNLSTGYPQPVPGCASGKPWQVENLGRFLRQWKTLSSGKLWGFAAPII